MPPVTLTFGLLTLKMVSETRDVGYLCLPRPLCSRLRPDVCDRQTDRRQTASSLGGIISEADAAMDVRCGVAGE